MIGILEQTQKLYALQCKFTALSGHEGGLEPDRDRQPGTVQYVLRISTLRDRSENSILPETEFVRFLAENDAPVALIPSIQAG